MRHNAFRKSTLTLVCPMFIVCIFRIMVAYNLTTVLFEIFNKLFNSFYAYTATNGIFNEKVSS